MWQNTFGIVPGRANELTAGNSRLCRYPGQNEEVFACLVSTFPELVPGGVAHLRLGRSRRRIRIFGEFDSYPDCATVTQIAYRSNCSNIMATLNVFRLIL